MVLCGFKAVEADKFGIPASSVSGLFSSPQLSTLRLDALITGFSERRLAQSSFDCTVESRRRVPDYYVLAQVQLVDAMGVDR